MKFYIASSLTNKEQVQYVSEKLREAGHIHTYDWTRNEHVSTLEQLQDIGEKERLGVLEADLLVVLLPGGKGTHVEMGIALAHYKKVVLYSPTDEVNNVNTTSTFYHVPEVGIVIGTLEELIEEICTKSP
ncbi:nucleoside 2-deoxyribosyltransferase [Bacillus timonensis]|nr:nucleoside 2-deoxyribosyltransferase [Bacillus timonensis]